MADHAVHPDCHVLIADDDVDMAKMLAESLEDLGYQTTVSSRPAELTERIRDQAFDVMVTDLRMPTIDGIAALQLSKQSFPERPVIVMTAFGAVDTAVESLRKGAYHYLLKPFPVAELDLFLKRAVADRALRREARTLKRAFGEQYALDRVVVRSDAMLQVRDLVERVADADVPVLFVGETGTGKGLIARALHANSSRASSAFVTINCAAVPENLLESELFGHIRGAFTGASASRDGLFVEANGGTLFLDEIGDMAPALQAKLLDVIERRTVRALGSAREHPVDVRIVAATHRDLRKRVDQGLFREDLLYRLEGIVVPIPALRQRREDIPVLIETFLSEAKQRNPRSVVERFSREAYDIMIAHRWPGNVRQLERAVTHAVLLARQAEAGAGDLPAAVLESAKPADAMDFGQELLPVRELQRRYIAWALDRVGGRKAVACEKLGIDAKTLNKWLADGDEK